jgi:hypothetical protein
MGVSSERRALREIYGEKMIVRDARLSRKTDAITERAGTSCECKYIDQRSGIKEQEIYLGSIQAICQTPGIPISELFKGL